MERLLRIYRKHKISFIVGGLWGLLASTSYPVFLRVLTDRAVTETTFIVWKVACLPGYLAEMLTPLFRILGLPLYLILPSPFLIIFLCNVTASILFGIIICIGVENLIYKFRKK